MVDPPKDDYLEPDRIEHLNDLDEGEVEYDENERRPPQFSVDQGEKQLSPSDEQINDFSKPKAPAVSNTKLLLRFLENGEEIEFQQVCPKVDKGNKINKSRIRYEKYKRAKNWKEFLELGGLRMAEFKNDFDRDYCWFKDPLIQAQFKPLTHKHHPDAANFHAGVYPNSIPPHYDMANSPFFLTGRTIYKFINVTFAAFSAMDDNEQKDIKLVDDPRFKISADLKELEGIRDPIERQRMYDAVVLEVKQLLELGTFEWDYLPQGAKPLSSRLVLKVKYHADGSYDKHKARLTIRGCFQVPGRDFEETFAPTGNAETNRLMDIIAVTRGYKLWQADISNAFCRSFVDVPIFLEMPRGIEITDHARADADQARRRRALRLIRALYGLKQWQKCG